MVKVSADCPLPVVNRDSMVIHFRQVLVCAALESALPGRRDSEGTYWSAT